MKHNPTTTVRKRVVDTVKVVETIAQWKSLVNNYSTPCEEGVKQTDHQCLQDAQPHRPLPPLLLKPPPESEVWYSRLPSITELNGFANRILPCQRKRSMSRMSWWQMATWNEQLQRSREGSKVFIGVANQRPDCSCHTSRVSARSIVRAGHWVYRQSLLPGIPSWKWKEDWEQWMWRESCTRFPVQNAQLPIDSVLFVLTVQTWTKHLLLCM